MVSARLPILLALAAAIGLSPGAAVAEHRLAGGDRGQDRARYDVQMGGRPLRDIQQQWRQNMPGYDFLGSDYDAESGSYRLKFMRGSAVDWVDVDGRTGREIGRSHR